MRRFISSLLPILSRNKDQQFEKKKINYWLEKLLKQPTIPVSTDIEQQTSEEKGLEDAIESHAGKAEKNRQAVEDMVRNSNRILLRITSVFPWDTFPTSVIVEETRLTIVYRQLFSSQVHSVDIKDISNIFVDTGILFAQLIIVSNTFAQNQIIIRRLWKKDAILMRRIIEGLRMFVSKDIDTTDYKVEELKDKLKQLSTTGIVL